MFLDKINAMKYYKKCLTLILTIVSIITFFNVLIMYLLPLYIPLSSFSSVRIMFISLVEKKYILSIVSVLPSILLFVSTISIRRWHIVLPMLSLVYIVCDFITLLLLLINSLDDGYWTTYIIPITISIVLILLLCLYCYEYYSRKRA